MFGQLKRLAAFVALLFLFGMAGTSYAADVHVRICKAKDSKNQVWGENLPGHLVAITRSTPSYNGLDIGYALDDSSECRKLSHYSCFTEAKVVYCNQETIARVLHGIAWVALGWSANNLIAAQRRKETGAPPAVLLELPFGFDKGLELADANWKEPSDGGLLAIQITEQSNIDFASFVVSVMGLVPTFRDFSHDVLTLREGQKKWLGHTAIANMGLAYMVYEVAANDVLAFLMGHELAHGFKKCPVDSPSRAETEGELSRLIKLQADGNLLCPRNLILDEALADSCALRQTQRIDNEMAIERTRDLRLQPEIVSAALSAGRRLAIDTLAWLVASGLSNHSQDVVKWVSEDGSTEKAERRLVLRESPDGYLYDSFRIILYSSLLHSAEEKNKEFVSLCDFTAKLTVTLLRQAQMSCLSNIMTRPPKERRRALAETLGNHFPYGVREAWSTDRWVEGTFSCSR